MRAVVIPHSALRIPHCVAPRSAFRAPRSANSLTLIFSGPTLREGLRGRGIHVRICVNGQPRDVPPETTVARLIADLEMQPRYLAVERNFELVPRAEHARCVLKEGDSVEIVTLVGGG